jgi:hypothetical protein
MTNNQLFAAALGITAPWFVQTVDFDAGQRRLTIHVDFAPGSRFAHPKAPGEHPVSDEVLPVRTVRNGNREMINARRSSCG